MGVLLTGLGAEVTLRVTDAVPEGRPSVTARAEVRSSSYALGRLACPDTRAPLLKSRGLSVTVKDLQCKERRICDRV